jgi:hypothetical protein
MIRGSVARSVVMGEDKGLCSAGGISTCEQCFHLGHASHAPYSGGGGGLYSSRDHPRDWAPHRPTFGGHGNKGFINNEGAALGNGSWGGRDRLGLDQVGAKDWLSHDQTESKETVDGRGKEPTIGKMQARSSAQAGGLNVARMLNTPEHVMQVLHKAFDAMKETQTSKSLQLEGSAISVEKKSATMLEVMDAMSKPTQVELPESSKQAVGQLNRKESGGKVPYCFRCKTKGHVIESCHAPIHCEFCDSLDHIKPRCLMF